MSERRAELEAQRRTLAAACTRQGWQLVEALEEAGLSATDPKRPGMQEALRVGDTQALVAHKRERLSPALLELVALLGSAQKQGWALVALDCTLETRTPAGEALATVARHLRPVRAALDLAADAGGTRARTLAGCPARPAPEHVPVRDRADRARASRRLEPGRDRERTEHGSHPYRTRRPPLVSSDRPLHARPRTVTLWLRRRVRDVRHGLAAGNRLIPTKTGQAHGLGRHSWRPHCYWASTAQMAQQPSRRPVNKIGSTSRSMTTQADAPRSSRRA